MPTRQVTVTVSTLGVSTGPFNISDDVLGVIAMGVTGTQLQAGYVVNTDVNSTTITVASIGTCTNSLNIVLPTPTPLPTTTPLPTSTPTPTPTVTPVPVYFDSTYTSFSNVCGQGGKAWTRLTGPSGSQVEITLYGQQLVSGVQGVSACFYGSLNQTTLPSGTPATGTELLAVSESILAINTPGGISKTGTVVVAIPSIGYKDLIIVYRTTNLTSNFSSGNLTATITAVDSVVKTNGDFIVTTYACSDTGTC
jgi:hypothetical protein